MARPTVFFHGWSDQSESFDPLARELGRHLGRPIEEIRLGDWVSMDNDIMFADLRTALEREWRKRKLPREPHSVDLVVHSTGALLIRDWMTRLYRPETVPIHRLLMLAPANFGSPLAHKGRAFIGRVVKGWRSGFETGAQILKCLELASPFTWDLAERDVFTREQRRWYGPGRVLATVLVGNRGYGGVRSAANEPGSDGTVRISTANLNACKLVVKLDKKAPSFKVIPPSAQVAFGIVAGENHGSIIGKKKGRPHKATTWDAIVGALEVEDDTYDSWRRSLAANNEIVDEGVSFRSKRSKHGFQNSVIRLRDHLGQSVDEYFIEFYGDDKEGGRLAQTMHEEVIQTVHACKADASYRSFYVDVTELFHALERSDAGMRISLMAYPEWETGSDDDHGRKVGYRWFEESNRNAISMPTKVAKTVFEAHRTLLVDMTIRREIGDRVVFVRGVKAT